MEVHDSPIDDIAKSRFKGRILVNITRDKFRSRETLTFKIYKYKGRTMANLLGTNGWGNPYVKVQKFPLLDIDRILIDIIMDELIYVD